MTDPAVHYPRLSEVVMTPELRERVIRHDCAAACLGEPYVLHYLSTAMSLDEIRAEIWRLRALRDQRAETASRRRPR